MKRREKTLAMLVGSLTLLFAALFAGRTFLLKPLQAVDRQTLLLRDKLRQIQEERRSFFSAEDQVKRAAQILFADNPDEATAQAGKTLTDLILQLGLSESDFTRTPIAPRKLRGAQEVGWTVQGDGPLPRIVDLLFLLEEYPRIHRLENVAWSADDRPSRLKVRFRFLTLVIDAAPETAPLELKPKFSLNSPERRAYDPMVQRHLLRPYISRSVFSGTTFPTDPDALASARPELLKVVSLSEWRGAPEVHVLNLASMKLLLLKPGDAFGGGQILRVDYRPRPMPGKQGVLSDSRMILQIGSDRWAVEHGQTLADKYKLEPEAFVRRGL